MSKAEDILSRQRRKAAAYSLASDLLSDGDSPVHIEGRLVNDGWSTEEAHEIVSALQAASHHAENALQGGDEDGRPSKYADNVDPSGCGRADPGNQATFLKDCGATACL